MKKILSDLFVETFIATIVVSQIKSIYAIYDFITYYQRDWPPFLSETEIIHKKSV